MSKRYDRLPDLHENSLGSPNLDDVHTFDYEEPRQSALRKNKRLLIAIITPIWLFICLAIALTIFHKKHPIRITRAIPQPNHCGHSAQEARSLGCHFDPISYTWLPTACYDEELTGKFMGLKEWDYRTAANDGNVAPKKQVVTGDVELVYVSKEYLVHGCMYTWKKMHRALISQGLQVGGAGGSGGHGKATTPTHRQTPKDRKGNAKVLFLDDYVGSFYHTAQCEKTVIGNTQQANTPVERFPLQMKYARCVQV